MNAEHMNEASETSAAEPIESYRGVVYPWHCDHMGHMNVMWYTGKFDEATWSLFSAVGITPSYLREQGRGMVAVQQNITYRRELLAGDLVLVRSWFLEARETVLRFRHEMVKVESGEVAAISELTGVHLDTRTRRSCPLPDQVTARARAMLSAAPPTDGREPARTRNRRPPGLGSRD